MNKPEKPSVGTIIWTDLTVKNAAQIRDFYSQVVGWEPAPVAMGDYHDFNMHPPEDDAAVVGVCHARGVNADLPPQWLIYITVADLDASAARCVALGGQVIVGPTEMGTSRYCVIQDPAGAVAALIELLEKGAP
jgi:predicted enzyme related to lactoylglutathione lyase